MEGWRGARSEGERRANLLDAARRVRFGDRWYGAVLLDYCWPEEVYGTCASGATALWGRTFLVVAAQGSIKNVGTRADGAACGLMVGSMAHPAIDC